MGVAEVSAWEKGSLHIAVGAFNDAFRFGISRRGLDDLGADCAVVRSYWFAQSGLADAGFPVPYQPVRYGFEVTLNELSHPSYQIVGCTSW